MYAGSISLGSKWMIIGWWVSVGLIISASILQALPLELIRPEVRLTASDVKPAVHAKIYWPPTSQPAPAIIILHGFLGVSPHNRQAAQALATHGYVAMVLDYYGETGRLRPRDKEQRSKLWPVFERTIQHAIQYLQKQPEVDGNRIGLVGTSMGASLAMSAASLDPAIKAVVAYYGRPPSTLADRAANMPPLLTLQGAADSYVSVEHANLIRETLTQHGRTVVTHIYPGAQHNFNAQGRFYDPEISADAQQRALTFLAKYLQPADLSATAGKPRPTASLYDTALHFYTVDRPALTKLPGGDIEKLFALPIYSRAQYQHTDDRGRTFNLEKRRDWLKKWWKTNAKRGVSWLRVFKVEKVEQTDDTHGMVTYTMISSWEHEGRGTRGVILFPGQSSWEKKGAHWRIVATKRGRPYRVGSMALTGPAARSETAPEQVKQKPAN